MLSLFLAAAAPLQPSGKWVVEYQQNMCVLSRGYGEGAARVTLGFRPYPMGTSTEVVLLTPGGNVRVIGDKAELTLLPGGAPVRGSYDRFYLPQFKNRIATLSMAGDALKDLPTATAVSLRLGRDDAYTFALPAIAAGLKALSACQDDLLKGWGIDPAERAALSEPPKAIGSPAAYFGTDAYPQDAIRAGKQGRTIAVAVVDASGKVKTCIIAETSGTASLDATTCQILTTRARFTPGKDKDGKPVTAHVVVPVRWVLPGY